MIDPVGKAFRGDAAVSKTAERGSSPRTDAMSMDLVRRIDAKIRQGYHVTTTNVGGMTVAKAHEPTDEARQAAIEGFENE